MRIYVHGMRKPFQGLRNAKTGEIGTLPEKLTPLNEEGIERAREIGREFAREDYNPQKIYCSPRLRTQQSLAAMLEEWNWKGEIVYLDGLAELEPEMVLNALSTIPDGNILVIGHGETVAAPWGKTSRDTWPGGVYDVQRREADVYDIQELSLPQHFTGYQFESVSA